MKGNDLVRGLRSIERRCRREPGRVLTCLPPRRPSALLGTTQLLKTVGFSHAQFERTEG